MNVETLSLPGQHELPYISASAEVANTAVVKPGSFIGAGVTVGLSSEIGHRSAVLENAVIGPHVRIEGQALVLSGAEICPDDVKKRSFDSRSLACCVTIGAGVFLDNEIELGPGAIVPSADTVRTMGKFGVKNRTVTIYGSENGARISIGCNIGQTFDVIERNVGVAEDTVRDSADTYTPYLEVFRAIGRNVQVAYQDHHNEVDTLKETRRELGLSVLEHR